MPSPWVWVPSAHVYRNTRTGRWLGQAEMLGLRDVYADAKKAMARDLAVRVASGDIDVGQWQRMMRQDVKSSFIDQYVLARGGRGQMTQADWGRVGAMLKGQYGFLDGFAEAIARGELSEAQIAMRAGMYHDSSVQAFERANALSRGITVRLPAYPGDGSSECLSNCRCHWDIQPVEGGFDCYWVVDSTVENCPTCSSRGSEWSPYEVRQ